MGVDPEVDDVMARPPRRAGAPVIDRALWLRMGVTGLLMGLVALLAIDAFLPGGLVPGEGSMDVARTAGFTTLVFAQLFNAFNARSLTTSAFSGLFSNRWLWAAVLVGAVLQVAVVNVPWLQVAFGTVPLELSQWAICVGLASVVLWADELVKLVLRRRS